MPELNRSLGKLIIGIAAATCSVVAATRTVQRSRRSESLYPALLRFSEPVGRLVGRIEGLQSTYGFGDVVFVRLENQGTKPLKVPTRIPSRSEEKSVFPFTAAVTASGSRCLRLDDDDDSEYNRPFKTYPTWSTITLEPGQACGPVRWLHAGRDRQSQPHQRPGRGEDRSQAECGRGPQRLDPHVGTPPYPIYSSSRLQRALAGQVPMPSTFRPSGPSAEVGGAPRRERSYKSFRHQLAPDKPTQTLPARTGRPRTRKTHRS